MKILSFMLSICAAAILCGCHSVCDVARANPEDLNKESTIVFTRSAKFTPFFGTHSMREFIEITYEKFYRNEAGQLVVEVGIRNRGPVSWTNWHRRAPKRLTLNTRCNFYSGNRVVSPMVYSTNRQKIVIERGETYAYKVLCPSLNANSFQLVLGD